MEKAEILSLEASRETDALVSEVVFGRCMHLNIKPVNPHSIQHSNAAKSICEKCGHQGYNSDFHYHFKPYSKNIMGVQDITNLIIGKGVAPWLRFTDALEEIIISEGSKVTTQTIALSILSPLTVCKAALLSCDDSI